MHQKPTSCLLLILSCLFFQGLGHGHAESANPAPLSKAGVLLSFDDSINIELWVKQIPLFDQYNAKATFFIEKPDQLNAAQKQGLRQLEKAGHEIGCHGYRHIKALDSIAKHGRDRYLKTEIVPAVAKLKALGFPPVSFAYPMSNNDKESDALIQNYFRHARTGARPDRGKTLAESDAFFTPAGQTAGKFSLPGRSIDRSNDERLQKEIFPALERARRNGEIIVFYAHAITSDTSRKNHIRPEMLGLILAKIKELDLVFYSMRDLP